ncbi:hypothetical protein Pmar_PMAR005900 [Perkinsus marinus ATCC 50983]|uniref:Hyaluronan/mRNA-binding protein domain-containing protein n=1 Tax=Perkinsus marinus (strain ATCC 50983 / TXsc) TaxID=423536 RepID=C5LKZ5_PERM5|nr:hypothetical protein Pmar_PMAR005900 [Perkinsus marinus ATCC 50983]EER02559.1 hypothetical protein Pmar_PMAR005900 [Perkinsus marinus ATCC 50983]|mmetsp:Transcript_9626/g.9483  ORF Transcript_9626/g.9483 Transcript_9626/m.9483 type:complete len:80 (-) Transcript_9626:26-265(-)|eukprot:XP_002769841.1 hypothetical protein Pmar_PMAR005900 [Perkinsus marinus ATCC 50983]
MGYGKSDARKERHSGNPKSSVNADAAQKKDGAGGKYTWGTAGDPPADAAMDKGDPNYDSEEEEHQQKGHHQEVASSSSK